MQHVTKKALRLLALCLCVFLIGVGTGVVDVLFPGVRVNRPVALGVGVMYGCGVAMVLAVVTAWRTRHREILLAASVSLILLLGLEFGLRRFHPAQNLPRYWAHYSATLHHVHPPATTMVFPKGEGAGRSIARTQEDGLRSDYSREAFLTHETRIAVLGDSFAFGLWVDQSSAMPLQLEKLLLTRKPERDVAVLNAGVSSYSPFLSSLQYDGLIRHYRPQLVLLLLDATDFGDDDVYAREAIGSGRDVRFSRKGILGAYPDSPSWIDHLAIIQRLPLPFEVLLSSPLIAATSDLRKGEPVFVNGIEENRFFHYRYPLEVTHPFFDRTLEHISSIARQVAADGGRFVLVVAPRYHHWNMAESPHNWEASYYDHRPYEDEYLRYLDAASTRVSFPILNLLPAFQATHEFPLVLDNDPHWNGRGHALVARVLADYILQHNMLDSSQDFSGSR